jgi:(Z)-2-((N-methylformamido)methylene)-5-hydroxybutyrolactone dehydrogenase
MKRYQMLIGGQWVDAAGGEVFETENPYLGKAWALVPRASALDVDRAVAAARNAFKAQSWSELSATARGALLRKLADLIAAEAERLAEIEVRDNGKLITEMRAASLCPAMVPLFPRTCGQDRRTCDTDR